MSQPISPTNPWWAGLGLNFFGSLISEPGWVDSLNDQPVVGWVGSDQVTYFDSSTWRWGWFPQVIVMWAMATRTHGAWRWEWFRKAIIAEKETFEARGAWRRVMLTRRSTTIFCLAALRLRQAIVWGHGWFYDCDAWVTWLWIIPLGMNLLGTHLQVVACNGG